nr:MAG TPA: hypothetical protein [Caudoviricetes sp.]
MSHQYAERNERWWCKLIAGTSKNRSTAGTVKRQKQTLTNLV